MTTKYSVIDVGNSYEIYLPDTLGSTRLVVDENETVTNAIVYDSYGNIEIAYSQDTPNYAFAGSHHYYADDTGLTYIKHRYYDSEVGRFISRDPIGYLGGFNLYNYTNGNPVNAVDPSGLLKILPNPIDIIKMLRNLFDQSCIDAVHTIADDLHNTNDKVAHCYMACELTRRCKIPPIIVVAVLDIMEVWPGVGNNDFFDMLANYGGGIGGMISIGCEKLDCEKYCEIAVKYLPNDTGAN